MKSFKEINKKETDLEEACWVGYRKDGMKKKGDRMVPNCVKEEVINAVYGKEWIYEEPTNENVGDMYKGKLSDTQITNLKNLWKNKKQSDVTPSVKSYVQGLDQFTKMDIKQANIKYLSNLIDSVQKEEVDFISPLQDQIEIVEMNSVVRKIDINEAYFSADQLERLAKAYNVMKDKTISLANAKKLGKMVDGIPAGALNDLRKKKIPFISGLALSRMIKLKVPVTEGLDKEDEKSVDDVVKQLKKAVKAHQGQVKSLTKDLKDEADLSKTQVKMVHKKADDMPKKGFMKRYGKDGDSVRYATATNMVKKKLGIEDVEEAFTKKDFKANERDNEHGENAKIVVGLFGTPQDVAVIDAINARHKKQRYISREDQKKRDAIVNKYYGRLKEERVLTNPEVAAALRQYIAQRPFISNKKDYEELMKLSLKDMNAFNVKFKSMNTDSQSGVKSALAKKGLSSTLSNDNKPKGDQTMNESYKDKFNATMKKFGINSLDDLKSDADKKKFFKAVDDSHDAKNEELEEAMNISTAKKEIQKIYDKAKKDDNLGGKGHDDFKDLLKQTDTKKLYPKMHKLGTFLASVRRAFGQKLDPSSAKAQALGNELIKLSYKVNEELEEELTPAQKKLPVGLQKSIAAKG